MLKVRAPTYISVMPRVLFLALLIICGASRVLDSTELLCGEWDLRIRCDSEYFTSELFPRKVSIDEQGKDVSSRRKRSRRQLHACHLRIHPNGTFCLSPDGKEEEQLLAVRGDWEVKKNPYCVTDRFYDEVVLTSYLRVRTEVTREEEKIAKQGLFTMHCRLFGHFSAGRLTRRLQNNEGWYARGKLSRGILQWENRGQDDCLQRSTVKASFTGHRLVPPTIPLVQLDESDDPENNY